MSGLTRDHMSGEGSATFIGTADVSVICILVNNMKILADKIIILWEI